MKAFIIVLVCLIFSSGSWASVESKEQHIKEAASASKNIASQVGHTGVVKVKEVYKDRKNLHSKVLKKVQGWEKKTEEWRIKSEKALKESQNGNK